MPKHSIRTLEQILDSPEPEEQRAGLILVANYGWTKARQNWLQAVEYVLSTAQAAGNATEAERLAIQQILVAIPHGQLIAVFDAPTPRPVQMQTRPAMSGKLSRIAICGNPEVDPATNDKAMQVIHQVARAISRYRCTIVHGPRGSGIVVANVCHNEYQSSEVTSELVFVDRARIVGDVQLVIVIGGARMTAVEADIAEQKNRPIAPMPGTGGTADRLVARMKTDRAGRPLLPSIHILIHMQDPEDMGDWLADAMLNGLEGPTQNQL
jgi:hypothetical protein